MTTVIFDTSPEFGKTIAVYLNSIGVETVCMDLKKPIRKCKIIAAKPDVILMPVDRISDDLPEKIKKLKSAVPRVKILAVSYILSFSYFQTLISSGVDKCLIMPASMFKIYTIMMELNGYKKIFKFEHFITSFLNGKGIPCSTVGFRNLSSSISYCIMNPERTVNLPVLYSMVAEDNSTTGAAVELSLRRTSAEIFESGAYRNFTGGRKFESRFTNYELLSIITDSFIEKYNLYPEVEHIHGRDFIHRLKK